MIIKYFFSGILFFAVSCRILVSMFALSNFPIGASFIVMSQYLCIIFAVLYCFQHPREFYINKNTKFLLLLFLIYSIYCFVYAFTLTKVPSGHLSQVPDNPIEMIRDSLSLCIMMALACMYKKKVYIELFAKVSVIAIILSLLLYFSGVDYTSYSYLFSLKRVEAESYAETMNIISGLTLGGYIGTAYICNLWLIDKWTQKRPVNLIIFIAISFCLFSVLLILGQRGPVLFTLITTILYFMVRSNKNRYKYAIALILILLFSFMWDSLLNIVSQFTPDIIDRFLAISDDNGSGRFGGNSIYSDTINMILEDPLFGNYFRLTSNNWSGLYPHNIILEFLVTFGLVFSIPIFILIIKATKNTVIAINNKDPMALFGLLFFHSFCCLLTSGTVLLDMKFWIMFAASLSISTKRKKFETPRRHYNY